MTLPAHDVIFHRLAGQEYLRARRWYARGEQLAERCCREVDDAIERIAASPEKLAHLSS